MMENKLWTGLCALLLLSLLMNVGSAELHDDVHATASSTLRSPISAEVTPIAPPADSLPSSSLNQTSHAAAAASNGSNTNPRSNDSATMNGESLSVTPQPKKNNDTNMGVSFLENSRNSTLQPPVPSSENHDPTSHISRIFTTASPPHTTHTAPANTATTTPPLNTSHHSTSLLTTDTITPSSQPAHPKAHSTTSSLTSELPGVTPRTKSTTTTTSTQSVSTPSTSSSQETHNSLAPTLTPPSNTSQSDRQVSETHPRTTITPLSSTFAQTKVHVNNPSQLNVGGDTETVSKSPTLDPLLAGLVSAFIITAIIITLLLFLKLRRRDNRPEFRRLQDLPMDDMMEDTPLSMYSY